MASKLSSLRVTAEKIFYLVRELFGDEVHTDLRCKECGANCMNQDYFCSQRCAFNYWIGVRKKAGKRLCMLPGCEKECYIEGGRQLDFCSRFHKEECEKQVHEIYGYYYDVKGKRCKLPGCDKLCYVTDYGFVHDFCNKRHSEQYKQTTDICLCDHCKKQTTPILFYEKEHDYYEFTNFFEFAPVELDGEIWKSTEHYFQAQKFIGTPYKDYIRLHAISPRDAYEYSRRPECSRWRRDDWKKVKVEIMYKALLAKFSQHKRLRQLLLSTRKRTLVEHTYNDSFWGDGGDGKGDNTLGKLLMKIRDLIRREE